MISSLIGLFLITLILVLTLAVLARATLGQ